MTNQELAERIKSDLNELIDRRGNVMLIPALVLIQKFLDKIGYLKSRVAALEELFADDEPYEDLLLEHSRDE